MIEINALYDILNQSVNLMKKNVKTSGMEDFNDEIKA